MPVDRLTRVNELLKREIAEVLERRRPPELASGQAPQNVSPRRRSKAGRYWTVLEPVGACISIFISMSLPCSEALHVSKSLTHWPKSRNCWSSCCS